VERFCAATDYSAARRPTTCKGFTGRWPNWVGQADSRVRVFYLATEPRPVCRILARGSPAAAGRAPASRVVLESRSAATWLRRERNSTRKWARSQRAPDFRSINTTPGQGDGPESDALRFGNVLLEPLWNRLLGGQRARSHDRGWSGLDSAAGIFTTASVRCGQVQMPPAAAVVHRRHGAARDNRSRHDAATRSLKVLPGAAADRRRGRGRPYRARSVPRRRDSDNSRCRVPGRAGYCGSSRPSTFVAIKGPSWATGRWAGVPFYPAHRQAMQAAAGPRS